MASTIATHPITFIGEPVLRGGSALGVFVSAATGGTTGVGTAGVGIAGVGIAGVAATGIGTGGVRTIGAVNAEAGANAPVQAISSASMNSRQFENRSGAFL